MSFSHIKDDISCKQASKKTDFAVDLIWWGSLRLTPITLNGVKSLIHSSRAFKLYRGACMQVYIINTLIQHSNNIVV